MKQFIKLLSFNRNFLKSKIKFRTPFKLQDKNWSNLPHFYPTNLDLRMQQPCTTASWKSVSFFFVFYWKTKSYLQTDAHEFSIQIMCEEPCVPFFSLKKINKEEQVPCLTVNRECIIYKHGLTSWKMHNKNCKGINTKSWKWQYCLFSTLEIFFFLMGKMISCNTSCYKVQMESE